LTQTKKNGGVSGPVRLVHLGAGEKNKNKRTISLAKKKEPQARAAHFNTPKGAKVQ